MSQNKNVSVPSPNKYHRNASAYGYSMQSDSVARRADKDVLPNIGTNVKNQYR